MAGRAPFYRCYECADGKYVSVGPLEPHFYAELLKSIGATAPQEKGQNDPSNWPGAVEALATVFRARTRDDWCAVLEGTDACFAPVLTYEESLKHAHLTERGTYVNHGGLSQAGPAPRFSRTPGMIAAGGDGCLMLDRWLQ